MHTLKGWQALEPVRTYLYPVVVAAVGVLFVRGLLDNGDAEALLLLASAVLGVGGAAGVESARSIVTPVAKLGDVGDVLGRDLY